MKTLLLSGLLSLLSISTLYAQTPQTPQTPQTIDSLILMTIGPTRVIPLMSTTPSLIRLQG